ncbi:MAG: DNA methyltransferase [Candidatus Aenigmatarchaeota archaeon]
MKIKIEEKLEWGKLATFILNKKEPIYNWFYFKKGFSKDLVFNLIYNFNLKSNDWVLDPFCGSGTTLLACKQFGINSIGFDILPVAVFVSNVKTRDYDINELKIISKKILKNKFQKISFEFPTLMKRAFNKYALEDIAFFKNEINKIENKNNRNFFLLALMNAAMKISYAWKDGDIIKIRKKNVQPLKFVFNRTIHKMIKDLENFKTKKCEIKVEQCDAKRMKIGNNTIDSIITSPPYLNQTDYTKIYEIENLFIDEYEKPDPNSYIGFGDNTKEKYFNDMKIVLEEMYRVCKDNAKIAIVIGNGYISGKIIESDIILSQMAEDVGFVVKKIFVLNKRFAIEKRTKKKGILRESLIILRK